MKGNSQMKTSTKVICLCVVVAIGVGLWIYRDVVRPEQDDLESEFRQMEPSEDELGDFADMDKSMEMKAPAKNPGTTAKVGVNKAGDAVKPTAGKKAEAEAEKRVEAFDSLTDGWMEGKATRSPTMKDIEAFTESFRKVPNDRKDECIHRALNLIPDGNVMLLAGVLMDKGQPAEVVDAIFSDILNRDEGVKLPVLKEIIKDPKHKCWKDAAWILDVTKQMPANAAPAVGQPAGDGRSN